MLYMNMFHAANEEMYSSINRVADDDDVTDIGKHDFRSVSLHLVLSNSKLA